jgi:hypothetical protein
MDVARLLAPFETPLPPPRLCGIALVNPKTALRGTQYAGMMNRGNFGAAVRRGRRAEIARGCGAPAIGKRRRSLGFFSSNLFDLSAAVGHNKGLPRAAEGRPWLHRRGRGEATRRATYDRRSERSQVDVEPRTIARLRNNQGSAPWS